MVGRLTQHGVTSVAHAGEKGNGDAVVTTYAKQTGAVSAARYILNVLEESTRIALDHASAVAKQDTVPRPGDAGQTRGGLGVSCERHAATALVSRAGHGKSFRHSARYTRAEHRQAAWSQYPFSWRPPR